MDFCPYCGGILVAFKGMTSCRCGYKRLSTKKERFRDLTVNMDSYKETIVVEEKKVNLPKTKEECPKCHNREAYWWMLQTRSSDEPTTKFYRCTKCNHTWREYD